MKAHLIRKLDAQMPESAKSLYRDKIACLGPAMAETIEGRDSRTEDRCGLNRRQGVGNGSDRFASDDHVLRVSTICMESGDLKILATHEVSTPAWHTLAAMPAVPSYAGTLALPPDGYAWTDGIDHPGHLVAGDARIDETRPVPVLREGVAMTHSAGFYSYSHRVRARLGDGAFYDFEGSTRTCDLHGGHL
jgi:hypothetical protein